MIENGRYGGVPQEWIGHTAHFEDSFALATTVFDLDTVFGAGSLGGRSSVAASRQFSSAHGSTRHKTTESVCCIREEDESRDNRLRRIGDVEEDSAGGPIAAQPDLT